MEFAYTILYVENVSETIEFYERAFGFTQKFITSEGDYGELDTGSTTIAFASFELGDKNFKSGYLVSSLKGNPFGIELAFSTEAVDSALEKAVEAGATIVSEVTEKPWGQKVCYVRDNNGFLIEICTPLRKAKQMEVEK